MSFDLAFWHVPGGVDVARAREIYTGRRHGALSQSSKGWVIFVPGGRSRRTYHSVPKT